MQFLARQIRDPMSPIDTADWAVDREIGFDWPASRLTPTPGEKLIDKYQLVEDRKGNPGIFGELVLTNLRFIWLKNNDVRINISVGYNSIINMALVETDVSLDSEHVIIKVTHSNAKYEFSFYRRKGSKTGFDVLAQIYNQYDTTRSYREILIRKLITQNQNLILFENEKSVSQKNNILNMGNQDKKSGRLILTNIRFVWISLNNENFNISVPWVRIVSIKKNSNFEGTSLVMKTSSYFGGLVLAFRDPTMTDDSLITEVSSLWDSYKKTPNLGTFQISPTAAKSILNESALLGTQESELLNDGFNELQSVAAVYREDADSREPRNIVFEDSLGVCMESLPKNVGKLKDIWAILT